MCQLNLFQDENTGYVGKNSVIQDFKLVIQGYTMSEKNMLTKEACGSNEACLVHKTPFL